MFCLKNKVNSMEYFEYGFSELELMPECPGIYAWYIRPNDRNLRDIINLFNHSFISIDGKGIFKEEFEGHLKIRTIDLDSERRMDMKFLQPIAEKFLPPIYIGVSKVNLRNRIDQHRRKINYYLNAVSFSENEISNDFEDVEVNVFSSRISRLIRSSEFRILENDIFVRAFTLDDHLSKNILVNTENFLNRTVKPPLGSN